MELFALEHQTDPKRMLKDVLALYCLTYGIHPIEAVKAIRQDVGIVEVIPARPLTSWPDVTPRADVTDPDEQRIRGAAWLAGEQHRAERLERAKADGLDQKYPDAWEQAQKWDQTDWDAAAAEYARLS